MKSKSYGPNHCPMTAQAPAQFHKADTGILHVVSCRISRRDENEIFEGSLITALPHVQAHCRPMMTSAVTSTMSEHLPLGWAARVQGSGRNKDSADGRKSLYTPLSGPQKRNTTAIQVFLQLLQVACKFSASCRKLVLHRCRAGE